MSIIDLVTGDQPIGNEIGNLRLACNGEIYKSPALRQRLLAAGHLFRTRTDVEPYFILKLLPGDLRDLEA